MEIRVIGSKHSIALISHWRITNNDWDRVNVTIHKNHLWNRIHHDIINYMAL